MKGGRALELLCDDQDIHPISKEGQTHFDRLNSTCSVNTNVIFRILAQCQCEEDDAFIRFNEQKTPLIDR